LGNVVQEFQPKNGGAVIATISDVVGPRPILTITGFADPVSGSWNPSDGATWQADLTNQNVELAKLVGSPQIKYAIGSGVLEGPVDALVFPSGSR
jgi:hypothetical protein